MYVLEKYLDHKGLCVLVVFRLRRESNHDQQQELN